MRKTIDAKAFLAMVFLCAIWGLQQVAIKAVATEIAPSFQMALRSGIAAVLVWIYARVLIRESWTPDVGRAGLLVGILFGLEFLLVAEGLRWTNAAHMAVFLYTAPIFAALVMHVILPDERLSTLHWFGIAIAFGGITLIFLAPQEGADGDMSGMLLGDFLGLCAGAAWGLTTVGIRASKLSEAPATQTLYYQLVGGFAVPFVVVAARGEFSIASTPLVWASMAFQSLIVAFASYLLWLMLLRRYLASRLGVISFMTPVFGVLFGGLLLSEQLDAHFLAGSALILSGMLLVNGKEWIDQIVARRTNL